MGCRSPFLPESEEHLIGEHYRRAEGPRSGTLTSTHVPAFKEGTAGPWNPRPSDPATRPPPTGPCHTRIIKSGSTSVLRRGRGYSLGRVMPGGGTDRCRRRRGKLKQHRCGQRGGGHGNRRVEREHPRGSRTSPAYAIVDSAVIGVYLIVCQYGGTGPGTLRLDAKPAPGATGHQLGPRRPSACHPARLPG